MALKDALQLLCFTLPYLYCTYSPAIAHPHYSPWFTFFFTLVCSVCSSSSRPPSFSSKAWASQDNAMLRQSDRKCLKSFLAGTGENQRDFKGVSQKQADAVAPCYTPLLHWHTQTHIHTQTNSHTWSSCHTYNGMQHMQREWGKKKTKKTKQTHAILRLYVPLPCLSTLPVSPLRLRLQGQRAIRSEPSRVFNV